MTEFLDVFASNYQVQNAPSLPAGDRSYDFAAAGIATLAPVVELSVTPDSGNTWNGRFFGDFEGFNTVINGPAADVLVVVAAGVAYVVPVEAPSSYHPVATWPVRFVCFSVPLGLVLLASFTDVVALGAEGAVQWEARDLVSDGFTDVVAAGSNLVVRGYVASEGREIETVVDLATGAIVARE